MNKSELIAAVAEKTGVSKKDAASVVNATFDAIKDTLRDKQKVQIIGFGTFETRKRPGRMGRNPRTGEQVKIGATTVPAFKAGRALKDEVKKRRRAAK